ncbi:hypothetical protein ACFX13_006285 [Malus domestica]
MALSENEKRRKICLYQVHSLGNNNFSFAKIRSEACNPIPGRILKTASGGNGGRVLRREPSTLRFRKRLSHYYPASPPSSGTENFNIAPAKKV